MVSRKWIAGTLTPEPNAMSVRVLFCHLPRHGLVGRLPDNPLVIIVGTGRIVLTQIGFGHVQGASVEASNPRRSTRRSAVPRSPGDATTGTGCHHCPAGSLISFRVGAERPGELLEVTVGDGANGR